MKITVVGTGCVGLVGGACQVNESAVSVGTTDKVREAASRVLVADLLAGGATVTAYNPAAMPEAKRIFWVWAAPELRRNPHAAAQWCRRPA
ncbi:MAG: hypothetical protein KJ614_00955 [Gammaproteobacteria bacterium]|uniref:hypothetical protein n=1 Tax=Rhodoferax sp. TaxID=50421 RepID=UPI0017FC4EB2|nr:hypothetical protein [Rhodoferax sp.]MBU3897492.1 hypothetical protein [Gammaproteobacteria bacterium]MBA3058000.1 hypothetical protein [Rhodoferax sp.]MBU3996196.1 hypothetical protein [Gammaproteobacteria bacterium]MBU4018838.1 hypothetical protein [Gammaproteobacteria bacterium]MBU4079793.1 hypothetical protein [Gammaproteobacteria bacterium]